MTQRSNEEQLLEEIRDARRLVETLILRARTTFVDQRRVAVANTEFEKAFVYFSDVVREGMEGGGSR